MALDYKEYLASDYWAGVSRAVITRDGGRCQTCNSEQYLQAHHRTYEHEGSEMDHLGDLVCLCQRCHFVIHQRVMQRPRSPRLRKAVFGPKRQHKRVAALHPKTAARLAREQAGPPVKTPEVEKVTLTTEFLERLRLSGVAVFASNRFGLPLFCGSPRKWKGEKVDRVSFDIVESEVNSM